MKTLQQIEPRKDLATVGGDATYHIIINRIGSYYLSDNLEVTQAHGIDVRAEGVTIDLNGFEIRRISGSGGNGIEVDATAHRCTVKNGSIASFAYGIRCVVPSGNVNARGGSCLQVAVFGCSSFGLFLGDGWQVEGCRAHGNTGIAGLYGGSGSVLTHCTAIENNAQYGISTGFGCTLNNCTARSNTSSATDSFGISVASDCTVTACTATENMNTNATSTGKTGGGISAGFRSTVTGCTVALNHGDGIQVNGTSAVSHNTCDGNGGTNGDGAGIHAFGNGSRIDSNNVTNNDRGIDVDFPGNLIIRNSARGNGANYSAIAAGNTKGEVVDTTAAGGTLDETHGPWANFSF